MIPDSALVALQQTTPLPESAGGVIADILAEFNVPYAGAIGSTLSFFVAFLAVYLVGRLFLLRILGRLMDSRGLDRHAKRPLRKLAWVMILFAGVGIGFGFAGYEDFLTSLATIGAALTLAVGFAMQEVLKNFVAGVFIFTEQSFRIGDWIEWDGNSGIVEDISLRVSRVRTFDNEMLTVPNSNLTDDVIKNPVANDTLRMKFTFGIGYDDDIEEATEIIVEVAEDHPEILEEPGPSVRLTELGDSDVGLQSRIWIENPARSDFVRIRGEYVTDVKQRFDEAGIDIPYPQRVLHGGLAVSDGPSPAALDAEAQAED